MILRNCPHGHGRLSVGAWRLHCDWWNERQRCDYSEPLPPDLEMRTLGERVAPTLPGFRDA